VGYAGGTKENPTYRNLGDHTETVQMDFDPEQVSYGKLLDVFWESHDPGRNSWSRQYMAAVFYHDEGQRRLAEEKRDAIEKRTGVKVKTRILPYTGFYLAEDYHQKHALRMYPEIVGELRAMYPELEDFISSTAVTRTNAYLGGYGSCDELKNDAEGLGLSTGAIDTLSVVVCGRKGVVSCPVPR
jgi:peptide-methionine (S)-S-oxide reductase